MEFNKLNPNELVIGNSDGSVQIWSTEQHELIEQHKKHKNKKKLKRLFLHIMIELEQIIDHIRNRSYMSGIEREGARVKATGEVFTPTVVAQHMLDTMDQTIFNDPKKTVIDNSCGDGQLISEALIRKVENGIDFKQALSTVYGVDLMEDNVELCKERLLCGREDLRHIVEKNIVCADALRYHYRFDDSHPYDDEAVITNKNKFFYFIF